MHAEVMKFVTWWKALDIALAQQHGQTVATTAEARFLYQRGISPADAARVIATNRLALAR